MYAIVAVISAVVGLYGAATGNRYLGAIGALFVLAFLAADYFARAEFLADCCSPEDGER